jgi:hypothetical protein
MAVVFHWVGRATIISTLCLALGLQWLALQSLAWATMLASNARHAPLTEAVARTFDGDHPCALCHTVATAKKSEKKSDIQTATVRIDLICPIQTLERLPSCVPYNYAQGRFTIPERLSAPPVPPPRSLPG